MEPLEDRLVKALSKRFPGASEREKALRSEIINVCSWYHKSRLGDKNAIRRLSSQDESIYWQQLSEILLANELRKCQIDIAHTHEGPDYLVTKADKKIWIEVITPKPTGLPDEWTGFTRRMIGAPDEAILLRWTAAIKQKAEVLVGSHALGLGPNKKGYISKGIVGPDDAYVIAVNSFLLRGQGGMYPRLHDLGGIPYAVQAVCPVGDRRLEVDLDTGEAISGRQYRERIKKPTGKDVRADMFLSSEFSATSALWAVDVDEYLLLGESRPMEVIHNPRAANPVPNNWLPAQQEYTFVETTGGFIVKRSAGRL